MPGSRKSTWLNVVHLISTLIAVTALASPMKTHADPLATSLETVLYNRLCFLTPAILLMSQYKKAGQKHSIQAANRFFEDVAKFTHLGTTLTDQNCIQEEIKSRLNSGNACYHSVWSHL
jgi:predicted ATPase